jgi:hypothetical protein
MKFDENKFVCFMIGGLTFSEICSLKTEKKLQNIILATDNMMSP